jgi:spore germination protein GerM
MKMLVLRSLTLSRGGKSHVRTVSLRVAALALLLLLALSAAISIRMAQRLPNSVIYFVRDAEDHFELARAYRRVPRRPLEQQVRARLEALIAGPRPHEADAGMVTSVPETVQVLDVSVRGGTAYINLSAAFDDSVGLASDMARLQQVRYTVVQIADIEAVSLLLEGDPLTLYGSDGLMLEQPWQPRVDAARVRW